ncbi:MAG: MaoC/PaaZ C-terminal domain-containing protein [Propionibacteriales bacterium]|nr:MaoC/PaaZ C-terminal domain-containing protein [Propionibacteriales bacterium]
MGTELAPTTYRVTRADLLAYAAASGDHNPIHSDDQVAAAVGLPGVIAHGMYTLALAARYVDEYRGEPGGIVELSAKFTKPVVVPAGADGTEVRVSGVLEVRDGVETVSLTVTCGDDRVLGNPKAVLRG